MAGRHSARNRALAPSGPRRAERRLRRGGIPLERPEAARALPRLPGPSTLRRVDAFPRLPPRALALAALALLAAGPLGLGGEPVALAKQGGRFEYGCRVQKPQNFLKRRTFVVKDLLQPKTHAKAVRYLAERYGNVGDEVTKRVNPKSARAETRTVHFMGLPLSVHAKVAPAVACVEKRIVKTCTGKKSRYAPRAVGGFRDGNTYRGAEISNHLFGIAIDIDPERNPCCGCVDPWPTSPLCSEKRKTAYERTALTRCWIRSFERFGFDWLGHDALEDTMHFEFLGDPDRIKK
jgi:D-alanyl-D-alanine carboxypeptidase